ncbi:hypothetical protein FHW83_004010 [Duganella sp. SG902]|uniref:hypothetical protein n=1 Tax=Duganella sp. SG902 TaxID=2587016 RepID=UPI00159DD215|nr:hypothetical protein [Duganella sp. SG902]NVM78186.1 hypothetical protein [Duganella sp. SG902]
MKILRCTLLADGTSDEVLIPIIDWLISENFPHIRFQSTFAKELGKIGMSLENRIPAAIKFFPCDILLVHRDEEGQGVEKRLEEINTALDKLDAICTPIIPVRMTEAWLLSDEMAIRSAAGNQNGRVDLKLPHKRLWETQLDPKALLLNALCVATEKSGRALKKFSPEKERALVARRTTSFAALRGLKSFDLFEDSLVRNISKVIENVMD